MVQEVATIPSGESSQIRISISTKSWIYLGWMCGLNFRIGVWSAVLLDQWGEKLEVSPLPPIRERYGDERFYFQQDGASPHFRTTTHPLTFHLMWWIDPTVWPSLDPFLSSNLRDCWRNRGSAAQELEEIWQNEFNRTSFVGRLCAKS